MNKARILAQIAKLQKEQCGLSYYIERNKADIIKLEKEYKDNQNLLDYYKGEVPPIQRGHNGRLIGKKFVEHKLKGEIK